MAYLPDYKWDIFISYAHADKPEVGPDANWISNFKELLKVALNRISGEQFGIYFDEHTQRYDTRIDDIPDDVRQSAIFLMIGSNNYVKSTWCAKEVKAFAEEFRDTKRMFVAELVRLRSDLAYPVEVPNNLRVRFWFENSKKTLITLTPRTTQFNVLVTELAQQIWDRIGGLRSGGVEDPPPLPPRKFPKPGEKTIFLAYAADDVSDDRIHIRDYLKSRDIDVLPDPFLPPSDTHKYHEAVSRGIAEADIFVQLLGRSPSQPVEGVEKGYTYHQYDTAKTRETDGLTIIQWRGSRVRLKDVSDKSYKAFLDGETVQFSGINEFNQRLADLARPPPPLPVPEGLIFINADDPDKDLALDLVEACGRKNRFADMAEPGKDNDYLRAQYANAAMVTFLYGNGQLQWVKSQFDIFRRAWAQRTDGKPPPLIVYLGPPLDKRPTGPGPEPGPRLPFAAPGLRVLDARDKWSVVKFENVLEELVP